MKTLVDQVVIVTGAAEGIGAACARELDRCGARLSLVDQRPFQFEGLSRDPVITIGDITDPGVRSEVLARTVEAYGSVNVLINNAGIGLYATASEADLDLASRMFDVNLFAALGMSQLVTPLFKVNRAGTIMNVGSIAGEVALPWTALYCASKAALHAVSDSLRRELALDGIRVITVLPGIVRTGFRSHVLGGVPPAKVEEIRHTVSPEELARAMVSKLLSHGSNLYFPRIGRLFHAADYIVPGLLDRYIQSRWYADRKTSVLSVLPRAEQPRFKTDEAATPQPISQK